VRRTALCAVNLFGLSDLVGDVRLALRDADPRVVVSACKALSRLCAKEALAELRRLLRHDSPDVRLAAIDSIAGLDAFDLEDDLARALSRLEDETIGESRDLGFDRTGPTPFRRRVAAAEESMIEMMRRRSLSLKR
jgi:HEAT repeat protein